MTPLRVSAEFFDLSNRRFSFITVEPLNNHVTVALGRAVTGQWISTLVPMTVVTFPPTTNLTSFTPLTATTFFFRPVILGALPSKERIKNVA